MSHSGAVNPLTGTNQEQPKVLSPRAHHIAVALEFLHTDIPHSMTNTNSPPLALQGWKLDMVATPDHQCWIDGLPDELISAILVDAASHLPRSDSSQTDDDYLSKRLQFPIVIQLVCQRWKSIALTTPPLWAILRIDYTDTRRSLQRLQRSGAVPLEVHIDLPNSSDRDPEKLEEFLLTVSDVMRHLGDRTWKLDISAESGQELQQLTKVLPHFSNLKELFADGGSTTAAYGLFVMSLNASQARKLRINGCALEWTTMTACPWLQELHITESSGSSVRVDSFATALQGFPQLRTLELENQVLTRWDDAQLLGALRPFLLEKLEVLVLRRFYMRELKVIFSLMDTPNLETFVAVGLFNAGGEEDHATVQLRMNLPRLQTLVLERVTWAFEIARELPQVKHLAILRHNEDAEDAMDDAFNSLQTHWTTLSKPLPLETLKTKGVHLSSLLSFLTAHQDAVVSLLDHISVHYSNVFISRDSEEFSLREKEWAELSSLVEIQVFDIPQEAVDARAGVRSHYEELRWRHEWHL